MTINQKDLYEIIYHNRWDGSKICCWFYSIMERRFFSWFMAGNCLELTCQLDRSSTQYNSRAITILTRSLLKGLTTWLWTRYTLGTRSDLLLRCVSLTRGRIKFYFWPALWFYMLGTCTTYPQAGYYVESAIYQSNFPWLFMLHAYNV